MRIWSIMILLAACATTTPMSTPKGGPRGLRASEHLDVAAQHDQEARNRSIWPDTSVVAVGGPDTRGQPVAMPWFRSWDTTTEHERLAAIHRGQAAEIEAAYEEACGDIPRALVTVSPLVRYGVGGWPTANGVILYLSPKAGTPDQLLAAMKCHRAYMMIAPSDMDDCPLDLPGLELDARGDTDGVTVSLSVNDGALLPELKRRAAHELEAAQHRGSGTSSH
jgi:hypothetical protein